VTLDTRSVAAETVGAVKYPEPLIFIVMLAIAPFNTVAVAVAPTPLALVNTIVGGVVNPAPPLTIVTPIT
jgi:hypothetical protein